MAGRSWARWGIARALAACVVLSSACSNLTTLSEASVIGAGEVDLVLAAGLSHYGHERDLARADVVVEGYVPSFIGLGRIGLTDQLELQIRVMVPGIIGSGVKVQLLGEAGATGAAISVGAELDIAGFAIEPRRDEAFDEALLAVETKLPISLGYRHNNQLAVYTTLKPGARLRLGSEALSTALFSQSLGAVIGDQPALIVELNWAWDWMLEGGDAIVGLPWAYSSRRLRGSARMDDFAICTKGLCPLTPADAESPCPDPARTERRVPRLLARHRLASSPRPS